jgi:hypothetical protein
LIARGGVCLRERGGWRCGVDTENYRTNKAAYYSETTCGNYPVIPKLAVDSNGQTIWIADAHRDNGKRYGKRYIVRAYEKLTAFLELESMIRWGRSGLT